MNEAYEVELTNLEASFIASPFDLVLGVERKTVLVVEKEEGVQPFTDFEFQIVYARVLIEDRWYFLKNSYYCEIDEKYADQIGDKLWMLINR